MVPFNRLLIIDGLAWGFLLWLIGYILGFVFFALVPPGDIGWYVTPLGLAATCFALWKWVKPDWLWPALVVGIVWCAIAALLDHLLIVRLLAPADGYYKLDVYLYYFSCLVLPPLAALLRGSGGRGQRPAT